MKVIVKNKSGYVLRFDEGEVWPEAIINFAKKNKIRGCWLSGFGAFKNPTISYYDHAKDAYLNKKYKGIFETLSLIGNISLTRKGIAVHNHVILGDKKYKAIGGHLISAEVGATLEVFLTVLPQMKRDTDQGGFGVLV